MRNVVGELVELARNSIFGPFARAQYLAVLRIRRQMLFHSLRSTRGKFELAARLFWAAFFAIVSIGLASACGVIAHQLTYDGELQLLPLLLWPVLVLWQVIPVMLASAQENVDFNFLLRFPVSFRSYVLLYLCFGIFDPASILGVVSLLGLWIGVATAKPGLGLWSALALAAFAFFNFLLTRTIFSWIERWLARRRTREILGMVFLGLLLGFQLLNPAVRGAARSATATDWTKLRNAGRLVNALQRPLPPGLTSRSMETAEKRRFAAATALLGGMTVYLAGVGLLLGLRLRAEYRGASLGEAPQAAQRRGLKSIDSGTPSQSPATGPRWFDGPLWAVIAKELRYLSRSGMMLFSLFAPLVILFAAGAQLRGEHSPAMRYAFPLAAAYGFLPLTRQVCNSLGGEGAGIQLYFLSPTPFRTVMLAKNLLQAGLFLVEMGFVCVIVVLRYGMPDPEIAAITFCWLLFALPANLAAGNMLSISMAYRMTLARLSREQGSVGNGLLSLSIQLAIALVGVAVFLPLAFTQHELLAAPVLLVLAVGSVLLWLRGLGNVDAMAIRRREALLSTLTRAA